MIRSDIEELSMMIDELTDCFYQQDLTKGYDKLEKLYPKLTTIIDELGILVNKNSVSENINNVLNNLSNSLQALECRDFILLSDILKYDLMGELNYISNQLDRMKCNTGGIYGL